MDDVILRELKRIVEQAVRPVWATTTRKRRMREELLAHLTAIFDEEAERLGDEQAALEQAKRRFGDPQELTGQLQQAVPRWDRCRTILENMGCQPGESAWHLAVKHFLAMLLIYSTYLPLWLLVHGNLRGGDLGGDLGPVEAQRTWAIVLVGSVFLAALFNVILSVILAPLLNKIGPVLASNRRGRILPAMLCGFAVLCVLAFPPFAGAAVLFLLTARQAVKQRRCWEGWA